MNLIIFLIHGVVVAAVEWVDLSLLLLDGC